MSHIDIFENSMTSGRNGWELSATLSRGFRCKEAKL